MSTSLLLSEFTYRYLFRSNGRDISFGISHVDTEGNRTTVLQNKRYNSHMVPEDGEIELENPGRCKLQIYFLTSKDIKKINFG